MAQLGDVIIGTAPGRASGDEITLFTSRGLAIEDLASARHIHGRARAIGVGTTVELGGERHE